MTFPSESTIKVNGEWVTLVAIPLEILEPDQIYETDVSHEAMLKCYHEALEVQASRQAELN